MRLLRLALEREQQQEACAKGPMFKARTQPTEPDEHPTVHLGQQVEDSKPGRGSTHLSTWFRQHSLHTPEQPAESSQHASSEEHTGALGSEPHCCASLPGRRAKKRKTSSKREASAIFVPSSMLTNCGCLKKSAD